MGAAVPARADVARPHLLRASDAPARFAVASSARLEGLSLGAVAAATAAQPRRRDRHGELDDARPDAAAPSHEPQYHRRAQRGRAARGRRAAHAAWKHRARLHGLVHAVQGGRHARGGFAPAAAGATAPAESNPARRPRPVRGGGARRVAGLPRRRERRRVRGTARHRDRTHDRLARRGLRHPARRGDGARHANRGQRHPDLPRDRR